MTKLDGVMRTMVIAGKAGEAILVMQPFRIFSMTVDEGLFIKVLSFLLSLVTKLDGVMRTMVIAGKAGEAILVMQPFRIFSVPALDIAYRTDVGTDATLHALVFLHMKPLLAQMPHFTHLSFST